MKPTRECCMRQLLNKISKTDESDTIPHRYLKDVKEVLDSLKQLDEENGQSNSNETLIDVQIYNTSNTVTYNCISGVEFASNEYNRDDFLHRSKLFMTDDNEHEYTTNSLCKLATLFDTEIIPNNPSFSSLYAGSTLQRETSPVSQKTKEKVVRQQKVAEKRKFINIVDQPLSNKEKTSNILKQYQQTLNQIYQQRSKQPINYYEFVLDKSNFGKTVENAFYTSFLVNNGSFKLFADGENNLFLEPSDIRECPEQSNNEKSLELAMNINYAQWRKICATEI